MVQKRFRFLLALLVVALAPASAYAGLSCTNDGDCEPFDQFGDCEIQVCQFPAGSSPEGTLGQCVPQVAPAGTGCGPGVTCNDCYNGASCNAAGACIDNPYAPNGSSCNPGNCTPGDACTTGACQNGGCVGSPVVCTASDECHDAGTCDPQTGCSNPPKSDGAPCGTDGTSECDAADSCQAGACETNNVSDGTACGDTGTDTECDSPDSCLAGGCEPNYEPTTTACGVSGAGGCTEADVCDGEGACACVTVPTMGEYGLGALSLLLIGAGFVAVRKGNLI